MRSRRAWFIVLLLLFTCSMVMAASPAEKARKLAPKIKDYYFKHQVIRIGLPAVEPLFEQLAKPKNERIAFETRSALRWIARDAKDKKALLDLLKKQIKVDKPAPVRCFAVELLGSVGGAGTVGVIAPLLSDAAVRDAACAALTQVEGPAATKALADAYGKADASFRCALVHAIGVRKDPAGTDLLSKAAVDKNEKVSLAAIQALGEMGCASGMTALEKAAKSGSGNQKAAAVDAMLALGDAGTSDDAAKAFGCAFDLAANDKQRSAALAGLGKTGGSVAAAKIEKAMLGGSPAVKAAAQIAYVDLADALWEKGEKDAASKMYLKALDTAAGEPGQVRALIGACRAGSPDSIPKIEALLKKGSPRVQAAAASAIKLIPGKAATQAMAKALPSAQPAVQAVLLTALGERADPDTVGAIAPLAASKSEEVAIAAVQALGRAGGIAAQAPLASAMEKGSDRVKAEAVQALLRLAQSLLDKDAAGDAGKVYARLLDFASDEGTRTQVFSGIRKTASPALGEKICGMIDKEKGEAREEAANALLACANKVFASDKKDASKPMYQKVLHIMSPGSKQAAEARYHLSKLGEKFVMDAKDGIVSQWWIIGTWRARDQKHWTREREPEKEWKKTKKIDLGKEYKRGKRVMRWMPVRTEDKKGAFDMNKLFINNDYCFAYCTAEIVVDKEQDVNLEIHSDDGHRLFVNGELVSEYLKDHKRTKADDHGKCRLKVGANQFLLKSCERSGNWTFSVRLTGKDGKGLGFKIQ